MSRATTIAAAAPMRTTELFGIARYYVDGEPVDFEVSFADIERDTVWAREVLERWGLRSASYMLTTGTGFEGPWIAPFLNAARSLGAILGFAEVYGWDANRAATFIKRLPIHTFLGVTAETVGELSQRYSVGDLLGGIPVLLARPDAVPPLRDAGLDPARFAILGPAVAVECPQRAGLHINAGEWTVRSAGDGLIELSSAPARTHQAAYRLPGTLVVAACPCGLKGQRIGLS
jgi:hypothetical protein